MAIITIFETSQINKRNFFINRDFNLLKSMVEMKL